jgi:hypothetical protein
MHILPLGYCIDVVYDIKYLEPIMKVLPMFSAYALP